MQPTQWLCRSPHLYLVTSPAPQPPRGHLPVLCNVLWFGMSRFFFPSVRSSQIELKFQLCFRKVLESKRGE
jgi:hypothetical protein